MAALRALFGLMLVVFVTGQEVEITPREAVKRIGQELEVLCKVPYIIDSCRISLGGESYRLFPDQKIGDVVYHGQGLESGECGALIKNIKEEWNGNISCVLPPKSSTSNIELTGTMRLVVARAPGAPRLISPPQSAFKEGDGFVAQCIVPSGRPAAKITWFLGEQELHEGLHQPILSPEPGTDLMTIVQNVSRTLKVDDDSKLLVCRAEHQALDKPVDTRRQLVVHYQPKRLESGPITVFGLKLGSEGRLNVTVRSNPPPVAEWTIGAQRLTAPQSSEDGEFTALEPQLLGMGYYNITLIVSRITTEDVDKSYNLLVKNDLGFETFTVRISTMAEPAGVELDTGAIVGIVVAVLVLLVAVFLAVFAFATDRWCFAGRKHRSDIPDGADSEAPLPPHDDIKGSENPSHDHGDYISNGDTKHPEKKPDTAV